jgi:hypothetical protein
VVEAPAERGPVEFCMVGELDVHVKQREEGRGGGRGVVEYFGDRDQRARQVVGWVGETIWAGPSWGGADIGGGGCRTVSKSNVTVAL